MPYQGGERLNAERASKLGHLEVLNSELVKELVANFESAAPENFSTPNWEAVPSGDKPLNFIFGVDGSFQNLISDVAPYKRVAYVKTALLMIDQFALSKLDIDSPHPFALADILNESSLQHATVFPLENIMFKGMKTYHAIRKIIFQSLKSPPLMAEPLETLKWLAYEKWTGDKTKELAPFACPHCLESVATLPYDAETGNCSRCKGELLVSDMLGFHLEMTEDSAPDGIANNYMSIHETLLLFSAIRYIWERKRERLSECLFVKDGHLAVRAQYSKIVAPIRRFLAYSRDKGYPVNIVGQEKSGRFYDHLQMIARDPKVKEGLFIPSNQYIKEVIQHMPDTKDPYGIYTNYGAKVFLKLNDFTRMILNIPTGQFVQDPKLDDLIGARRIFATIPNILSHKFESGLLPIELAHGIASLSDYPSAHILKLYAGL